jgi:hypothetical protein
MTMNRSPAKLPLNMFKQGMRVMFVNLINVRQPPFITGKLGQRLAHEDATFDVHWEGTINIDDGMFTQYYDDIPLIVDGVDREDEINLRTFVHEARMVSYGCNIRDAMSFGMEKTGNMLDASLEAFGFRPVDRVVGKNGARSFIKEINDRTINRVPNSLITIPIELFNEIKTEAIPKMEKAMQLEEAIRDNPTLRVFVDKKELMENIPPLLKWAYNYDEELIANIPQPPQHAVTRTTPTTPPAATTTETGEDDADLMDDIMPDEVPTVQTLDKLVSSIRASKFGQLQHINDLKGDVEVVVSYIVFLLMVLGRNTTSNVTMEQEHDWYATLYEQRIQFING